VRVIELARRSRHLTSPHNTAGKFGSKHFSSFHSMSSSPPASFFVIHTLVIHSLVIHFTCLSPSFFSEILLQQTAQKSPASPTPPAQLAIMGLFSRKRAVNGATNAHEHGHEHGPDRPTSHESPRSQHREKFNIDSGYYNRRPSFGQWLK